VNIGSPFYRDTTVKRSTPYTPTLSATIHIVTDRQTDRHYRANSRSCYCVAVQSAEIIIVLCAYWCQYRVKYVTLTSHDIGKCIR